MYNPHSVRPNLQHTQYPIQRTSCNVECNTSTSDRFSGWTKHRTNHFAFGFVTRDSRWSSGLLSPREMFLLKQLFRNCSYRRISCVLLILTPHCANAFLRVCVTDFPLRTIANRHDVLWKEYPFRQYGAHLQTHMNIKNKRNTTVFLLSKLTTQKSHAFKIQEQHSSASLSLLN